MSDCSTTDHHTTLTHPLIYPSILDPFSPCQSSWAVCQFSTCVCYLLLLSVFVCQKQRLCVRGVSCCRFMVLIGCISQYTIVKADHMPNMLSQPGLSQHLGGQMEEGIRHKVGKLSSQILNFLYSVPAFSA